MKRNFLANIFCHYIANHVMLIFRISEFSKYVMPCAGVWNVMCFLLRRYTPKPYFTAPTTTTAGPSPSQSSLTGTPAGQRQTQPQRPRSGFNSDAWQAHKQRDHGYNRGLSYAKAVTPSSQSTSRTVAKPSSIEVVDKREGEVSGTGSTPTTPGVSGPDRATMRKTFEEMFKGRIDSSVIDMVLQDVNWNGECLPQAMLLSCGVSIGNP